MATERPGDYPRQAPRYDETRGASPVVVKILRETLGPGGGRSVLDVAGGTGNYAVQLQASGFDVRVLDIERAMVERSVAKIGRGRQVVGDAAALPFRDRSFDAVVLLQALHLIRRRERALAEVRRVMRDGPFVLQAYTRENLGTGFVFEYFPGSGLPPEEHPPEEVFVDVLSAAGFSRVDVRRYVYTDTVDANLMALHVDARKLASPAYLRNTSFFHRIREGVRREGLARLAADLERGVLERRVDRALRDAAGAGHGTVFAAWP